MDLKEDLGKFEKDLESINKKLESLEAEKRELYKIGLRLEGAIAYIRSKQAQAGPEPKG